MLYVIIQNHITYIVIHVVLALATESSLRLAPVSLGHALLLLSVLPYFLLGFPSGSVVKNLPANAGNARDADSTPGLGRSPGVGHGNPL